MIDWVEISRVHVSPIDLSRGIYSRYKYYNYYFVLSRRSDSRYFEIDSPCSCPKYRHKAYLRNSDALIPDGYNSVVVGCRNCMRQTMRVVGLIDHKWHMFIHRDIYRQR